MEPEWFETDPNSFETVRRLELCGVYHDARGKVPNWETGNPYEV
jgi:hypothetical protein